MSIVRCTAYPFRYAEEAYAESADEADALELFDSSLYTGMFSIDFDTRRAGRPCLDGAGRKRNLAQQIGKALQARPVYCRKTGAYEVGGWNVAGANCGHESAVFSPPFPMEDRERVFAVLDALQSDDFLPVDGFTIHMIPAEPNRQTILNMCNILQSRSELIAQALRLQEELRFCIAEDLAFTVMLDAFAIPETEACLYLLRQCYGMAAATGKARMKPCDGSNPKFQMRSWLLRLGFIGEEYERPRHTLLSGLEGDGAFFTESGKKRALEKRRREKAMEWMA